MTTLRRVAINSPVQLLLFAGIICLLATGCATYQQKNRVITYWREGKLTNAVTEATKMADKNANNKDAVIWRLEQGTVLRGNGQYEASNKAFDLAQDKIDQYAQEAKVKVGHEAGALLSNQANLPYEGRAYDGIMLNTYEALNYLALGETDKARPELIRAYQRQQDAVAENQRRIEKAQAALSNQKPADRQMVEKAQNDPAFKDKLSDVYSGLDKLKPYADYVNPFTVYLDGLYFMANAADGSDLERAHKSLERVAGFVGDNDYIQQDLAAVNNLLKGKPLATTTYVIFATGCAPQRGQIRIDMPTFWPEMPYLGAAFPKLEFQNNYIPNLIVTVDGTNLTTTLLSSMDSVIGRDFQNELPAIITKTLLSTAIKATATHFAWEATRQRNKNGTLDNGGIAGVLVISAAVIWQVANNIADTRTWTTLPKEFQFCRFPTPPDRKIELSTPNGSQKTSVTIEDGTINLVYVKSIDTTTPLLVSQMKLK